VLVYEEEWERSLQTPHTTTILLMIIPFDTTEGVPGGQFWEFVSDCCSYGGCRDTAKPVGGVWLQPSAVLRRPAAAAGVLLLGWEKMVWSR
jgi:hypothetical protein